jgi:hypothetical protein
MRKGIGGRRQGNGSKVWK